MSSSAQALDQDRFRHSISHLASGVTVVTSRWKDRDYGITASAVTSLTLDPPTLLVCINRNTGTQQAISGSEAFAVNILAEDGGELAKRFATPDTDKFDGVGVRQGEAGPALLLEALATFECRVVKEVAAGTHQVFFGEVERTELREGAPLTYYQGRFGRLGNRGDDAFCAELRERILMRDVAVDEVLDPGELAAAHDVSLDTAYHALARLSGEQLVRREAGTGYVVTALTPEALTDVLDARRAIEIGAAAGAVGRLEAEALDELERRANATLPFLLSPGGTDVEGYVRANTQFHEYLVELAHSATLFEQYRRLSAEGVLWRAVRAEQQLDARLGEDHVAIAAAYRRNDLAAVVEALHEHTETAKQVGIGALARAGGAL